MGKLKLYHNFVTYFEQDRAPSGIFSAFYLSLHFEARRRSTMDETAYEHLHENPSVCGEDFWKIKQTLKRGS